MKLRKIKYTTTKNKFVLLRDDFNVQFVDGKITDTFRIEQSMPTIRKLVHSGAKVAICAHLGRPDGKRDIALSLKPIADYMKIPFIPDCLDKSFLKKMKNDDVVLLENLRFYPGEESNNPAFAEKLAKGFDIFVNDAFATCHRIHASTVGIAQILPSFAGELLASEVKHLGAIISNPQRPLLSIIGGNKVSTKIGILKTFAKLSDTLIIDGALGTTFSYALGNNVGNSLYELDQKNAALEILKYAKQNNCKILLPLDKGVAKEFTKDAKRTNKNISEIKDDDIIIDAGIKTTARNVAEIKSARTVIWNGTVGMAQWIPNWSYGSFEIAKAIAEQTRMGKLESVVGGGDTIAALQACGVRKDITYVSTGGGAFLEFLEKKTLPAIEILEDE